MNATDVVGYTYEASFYCVDCLPDGVDPDGEDVGAVFADSEWDYYPACDSCGERCEDVRLTSDGEAYEHPDSEEDEGD